MHPSYANTHNLFKGMTISLEKCGLKSSLCIPFHCSLSLMCFKAHKRLYERRASQHGLHSTNK